MRLDSPTVLLTAQPTYSRQSLEFAVDRVLSAALGGQTLRTARVLLKPNLITARYGTLPCTDAQLIGAVGQWFSDHGARSAIGDSPAFGSARTVLTAIGAFPLLQKLAIPVVEFRRKREITLSSGHRAALAAEALDCDLLINLPKVKAHGQMRVTLAVKNYFGCVSGLHKPWWHMVHGGGKGRFAELLVELLRVLPAGCTVADGILAMHTTGPIHGSPYPLGVIAAGTNPVAIDTALLAVLGLSAGKSPLWLAAQRAALRGTDLAALEFPLARPAELAVADFIVPETLDPVRFDLVQFIRSALRRLLLRTLGR